MRKTANIRPNGKTVLLINATLSIIGIGPIRKMLQKAKQLGLIVDMTEYNDYKARFSK